MKSIFDIVAIIIFFPIVALVVILPALLIMFLLTFSLDIHEEGGVSLAAVVSLLLYFIFVTKTEMGKKMSALQMDLVDYLPGYGDGQRSSLSKLKQRARVSEREGLYRRVKKFAKRHAQIHIEDIMEITGYNYANAGITADRLVSEGVVTEVLEKDESYKAYTEEVILELLDDARGRVARNKDFNPSMLQREMMMPYRTAVEIMRRLKAASINSLDENADTLKFKADTKKVI